ncbi:recombination regulator RecX [Gammaproteobacteria bacterium]|nr:recombination regulator RecX [Gammaproteobacteria bacterium]
MSQTLKQLLVEMLARREYAVSEAKKKLLLKGYSQDETDQVLAQFIQQGLICDQRYIEAKVGSLQIRGYGPMYVKIFLSQMGLDFNPRDYDWSDAYQVAARKAGGREGVRRKQYLYRRGFTHEC